MQRGVQRAHGVTRRRLAQTREEAVHEGGESAQQHATAEAMREAHVFKVALARRARVLEE
jgi:hypothetical protein